MVRPTPRAFPSEVSAIKRQTYKDRRLSLRVTFHRSRFKTVALAGFVPIYSGGTARDLHPLPIPRRHNVGSTLGDRGEGCQVH
jgi:hypothetical protein